MFAGLFPRLALFILSGSPPCWTSAIGSPAPASATSSPAGGPQPH